MEFNCKILTYLLDALVEKWEVKYLGEFLQVPLMMFARVVAREVGGCDIRDCFGIDAYDLRKISISNSGKARRVSYFPPPDFFGRYWLWSHDGCNLTIFAPFLAFKLFDLLKLERAKAVN